MLPQRHVEDEVKELPIRGGLCDGMSRPPSRWGGVISVFREETGRERRELYIERGGEFVFEREEVEGVPLTRDDIIKCSHKDT